MLVDGQANYSRYTTFMPVWSTMTPGVTGARQDAERWADSAGVNAADSVVVTGGVGGFLASSADAPKDRALQPWVEVGP